MGNNINIGDSNIIEDSTIAGGNVEIRKKEKKRFVHWLKKHLEAILSAIISGAVSAIVAALITYFIAR